MSRIVQVSAYYPPHLGGQENAVYDLSGALAQAGHEVHVITSAIGAQPGSTTENGVQVHRLPGYEFGHAPIMPSFPHILSRTVQEGSVVHLHIGQAFTPEMVWLVSKLRHVPYIAQLHIDFQPSSPAGALLPVYKRLVLQRVLRAARAVAVLNEKTLSLVRDSYGYNGHAQVISNGIDESFFTLRRKPFLSRPPRIVRLLFVGRLSKQKNIPALLDAVALTHHPIHLDIIGEGEEREAIVQRIAKLGLTNVTMHGRLPRARVMRFYRTTDALVMPSLYEAQPMVLLEAMAARVPIIGTNVVGVGEHINGIGISVPPTPKGLASGMQTLVQTYAALPVMAAKGLTKAEGSRWANLLKDYEELYARVA